MAAPMNTTNNKFTEKLKQMRETAYLITEFDEVGLLDYNTFFDKYLLPNKPCVLAMESTDLWKSREKWVGNDGGPSFTHLLEVFGDAIVPVANCKQEEYSSHPKQDMLMKDFLQYWENYRANGHSSKEQCLYMKDWHCTKAFPDYGAYVTPVYFKSDWLNEFWDTLPQDGYRFVYMGPKGTWTPFHSDVYRSHSWSANICGKKRWIFYPPGCEEHLKDRLGNLIYDVTSLDGDNDDITFPNANRVKCRRLEVIQGPGQIIFVPSGWHHQVINLEDTISINHNWLNGSNVDLAWKHLQQQLADVKKEIADCRDMDEWHAQCQLLLLASAGIDYKLFIHMLKVIAENRIKSLNEHLTTRQCETYTHTTCSCLSDHRASQSKTLAEYFTSCMDVLNEKPVTCRDHDTKNGVDSLTSCHGDKLSSEGDFQKQHVTCRDHDIRNVVDSVTRCNGDKLSSECDGDLEGQHKRLSLHFTQLCHWCQCNNADTDCIHFILFDLTRIRDICEEIVQDSDYKLLDLPHVDSAEYVLNIVATAVS